MVVGHSERIGLQALLAERDSLCNSICVWLGVDVERVFFYNPYINYIEALSGGCTRYSKYLPEVGKTCAGRSRKCKRQCFVFTFLLSY